MMTSGGVLTRGRMMLELVRFSHTIFALPFALLATLMALRVPTLAGTSPAIRWQDPLGVLLCMVFARTAAMAFNRIVDQRFDAANPRTAGRHLPAGLLKRKEAIALTLVTSIGFVASTLLFLPNQLPLYCAFPVLAFLLGYSFAKRFTSAAHLWLGIALSLAPICAWVAVRGETVVATPSDLLPAVLLAVAVALWVTGFDIIYACQDADFDRQAGLRSVPARFGVRGALKIAAGLHAGTVVALAMLPVFAPAIGLGWMFSVAVVLIAALLAYEHWIISPTDLGRVGVAFFNVNAVISLVVLVVGSIDCWF